MPGASPIGRELALRLRQAYEEVSPFIERHTSRICPTCSSVCCIDRHGRHEPVDEAFLMALGEKVPGGQPLADDTVPCRMLGPGGCSLMRWQRPFRCTGFFCAPLIKAMPSGDMRGYREFMAVLRRLQALRQEAWEIVRGSGALLGL